MAYDGLILSYLCAAASVSGQQEGGGMGIAIHVSAVNMTWIALQIWKENACMLPFKGNWFNNNLLSVPTRGKTLSIGPSLLDSRIPSQPTFFLTDFPHQHAQHPVSPTTPCSNLHQASLTPVSLPSVAPHSAHACSTALGTSAEEGTEASKTRALMI